MLVHSTIFQGQLIEKNRTITLIVWVLGTVEKMPKKGKKVRKKNIFFVFFFFFNQILKCFYVHFSRAF